MGWGDVNFSASGLKAFVYWCEVSFQPAGLYHLRFDLWEGGEGNKTGRLHLTYCMYERERGIVKNQTQTKLSPVCLSICPISRPMACLCKSIMGISTKEIIYALFPGTNFKIYRIDT